MNTQDPPLAVYAPLVNLSVYTTHPVLDTDPESPAVSDAPVQMLGDVDKTKGKLELWLPGLVKAVSRLLLLKSDGYVLCK